LAPSGQAAAWQIRAPHDSVAQSVPELHAAPTAHFVGQLPPQSLADSEPFTMPSEHVGAWQMPPVQTPDAQSVAAAQCELEGHLVEHA
jgi:hypothetical protein